MWVEGSIKVMPKLYIHFVRIRFHPFLFISRNIMLHLFPLKLPDVIIKKNVLRRVDLADRRIFGEKLVK